MTTTSDCETNKKLFHQNLSFMFNEILLRSSSLEIHIKEGYVKQCFLCVLFSKYGGLAWSDNNYASLTINYQELLKQLIPIFQRRYHNRIRVWPGRRWGDHLCITQLGLMWNQFSEPRHYLFQIKITSCQEHF